MGLKRLLGIQKWTPDLTKTPPNNDDWPKSIITLTNKKFNEFIEKYPVVLVDFWAPWCEPCKTLKPRFRQLSKEYRGKVAFGRVNVDSERELGKKYHVLGIPDIILFSYGEKIKSITGVKNIDEYQKEINKILDKFNK